MSFSGDLLLNKFNVNFMLPVCWQQSIWNWCYWCHWICAWSTHHSWSSLFAQGRQGLLSYTSYVSLSSSTHCICLMLFFMIQVDSFVGCIHSISTNKDGSGFEYVRYSFCIVFWWKVYSIEEESKTFIREIDPHVLSYITVLPPIYINLYTIRTGHSLFKLTSFNNP